MDEEVRDVDERIHEREEDTHSRTGVLTTLDFHDEVRDVDESIHEREEDTHRRMDVLTALDFHDFRRTSAKTHISSDLMNRSLSTGT